MKAMICAGVLIASLSVACTDDDTTSSPERSSPMRQVVEEVRAKYGMPAAAVASFSVDDIEIAVDGVRRSGELALAAPTDLFHFGSQAKAILATATGALVEDSLLTWSLTVGEAFPELTDMDDAFRPVTLAQLLQHRSGLPALDRYEDVLEVPQFPGDLPAQRQAFAAWILERPAAVPVGSYLYSNAGYTVAAAILEKKTGLEWQELVRSRVLDPIGADAFVGWPLDHDANEPYGHSREGTSYLPIDPVEVRIPGVVSPAGDLSLSIDDYAKFAQLHLRALTGHPTLLDASTFRSLHDPVGDYAMGWSVLERGGERVLYHRGASGVFYAFTVLYRNQRHGYAVVFNADGPEMDQAVEEIILGLASLPHEEVSR